MPPTVNLSVDDYPRDGWPSSWGGQYAKRPGGMGIAYELKTDGSFGFCKPLNAGILGNYQNGPITTNVYVTNTWLTVSDVRISFRFHNWVWAAQTVDIQVTYLLIGALGPAGTWIENNTIPVPIPRKPFFVPTPVNAPPVYPGGIINPVKFTPFTVYGTQVWTPS